MTILANRSSPSPFPCRFSGVDYNIGSMQCRKCGIEIADKAIVCYRCGTSTTEPVRAAIPLKRRRNPLLSVVVAAVLLLLALYMGQASRTASDPARLQTVAAVLAGIAVVVLFLRLARRR